MMLVNGKEIFDISEVTEYMEKFEDKLQESYNKINQLKVDIERLDAEIDACMEVDILSGTAISRKDLSNVQARKANVESQLDTELQKVTKIKEIRDKKVAELIPKASKSIQQDLATFNSTVERETFARLQEIRQKQEELLLTLALARNTAIREISKYNQVCNFSGLTQYEKTASSQMFHNAGFTPHRSFPELGSPLINCNNLLAIEDVLGRSRADANAQYNGDKSAEDKKQLPPAKTLKDIDLQKFLDEIKE